MMSVWQAVGGHQLVYERLGQKIKNIPKTDFLPKVRSTPRGHKNGYILTTELRKVMKSYEKL